jgi:hypothetical protein
MDDRYRPHPPPTHHPHPAHLHPHHPLPSQPPAASYTPLYAGGGGSYGQEQPPLHSPPQQYSGGYSYSSYGQPALLQMDQLPQPLPHARPAPPPLAAPPPPVAFHQPYQQPQPTYPPPQQRWDDQSSPEQQSPRDGNPQKRKRVIKARSPPPPGVVITEKSCIRCRVRKGELYCPAVAGAARTSGGFPDRTWSSTLMGAREVQETVGTGREYCRALFEMCSGELGAARGPSALARARSRLDRAEGAGASVPAADVAFAPLLSSTGIRSASLLLLVVLMGYMKLFGVSSMTTDPATFPLPSAVRMQLDLTLSGSTSILQY